MFYHPFRHPGLKILSIGIAVLLWLTVAGEPVVERNMRVPLELQNTPEQLAVVESPPSLVDVRLRGASSVLSHLDAGDVVAVVDLDQAHAGSRLFNLTARQVRAPFGVEVVEVTPGSVSFKFEPAGTKLVPVVPVVDGTPAQGFVLGGVVTDPREVEAAGPDSSLKDLKQAVTEPVSIEGATASITDTVTIGVADPRLRLTKVQNARVTVEIRAAPWERTMEDVPVRLRGLSPSLRASVQPSVAAIMLRGPMQVLSALQTDSLVPYVDLAGMGPGRYNLPIRLEPPQKFEIVRTQPATVTVTVR